MNRTITMNLSGIIFHIEEDAYEQLNRYLSTIRSYFSHSDGRDEIMNDIESRIAEMLQEKVSKNKQAVLMQDVEQVIAVMGKPEDFAGEAGEERTEQKKSEPATGNNFSSKRRRVFRDTDDKILGGVCSGIGTYFDFDPIWLRGAFAVSFFLFGTGLLLYIILWIIMPEAKTTAEKLEMRGEKVDVNNIGKAVNEEFEEFKKRMKKFGDEVNSTENKDRIKTNAQKAGDFIGDVFGNMVRIILKIMAIFFTVLAVFLIILLLSSVFGSTDVIHINHLGENYSFSFWDVVHNIFPEGANIQLAVIGVLLFIGIPLLSIIYGGIKFLMGIKQKNRIVKYTFNILWLCGLGILIYTGINLANDFSEDASVKRNIELTQKDTLFLSIKNLQRYTDDMEGFRSKKHFRVGKVKWSMIEQADGKSYFNCPLELDIIPSETDSFQLTEIKMASGGTKSEAGLRARNIRYTMSQHDSLLEFEPVFQLEKGEKWRDQEVRLILKVPRNKVIYLAKGMEYIMYDIENVSNTWDSEMVGRRWIMKPQGLTCIDCEGLDISGIQDMPPVPPVPPALPKEKK